MWAQAPRPVVSRRLRRRLGRSRAANCSATGTARRPLRATDWREKTCAGDACWRARFSLRPNERGGPSQRSCPSFIRAVGRLR